MELAISMVQCGGKYFTKRVRMKKLGSLLLCVIFSAALSAATASAAAAHDDSEQYIKSTVYKVKGKQYKTLASNQINGFKQQGEASWYGGKFHGRKTANGEIFSKNALTAAHKTLPFGTKVEVTNLENGKKVVVRINDRGPFKMDRIIDLSKAAAGKLDMIKSGVQTVSIRDIE